MRPDRWPSSVADACSGSSGSGRLPAAAVDVGERVAVDALAGTGVPGLLRSGALAFVEIGRLEREVAIATLVGLVVTASLPLFLYGAWIVVDAEVVTWSVLTHHLRFVGAGLVLTTIPMVSWMVPRLIGGISGLRVFHAFWGLQAYALLLFGLTGIVHIFRAKRAHSLYEDPDQDVALSDLHENVDAWRFRLRVGVFGYLFCWIVAWLLGLLLLARRILTVV